MKISVITISYNQARFLRQCLESVLSQEYTDFEYIVVDPGSTDGSREIIDSYGDKLIKVFEKDSGPADGLNRGFKLASGELFCYLNSDDIFLPGAFQLITDFFQEHELIDIVCGHARVIDQNSSILRDVYSDKFNIKAVAYGAAVFIQPSTFFRRRIFNKTNGFNIHNRSNWDGELLIDMALAFGNIYVLNKFLSGYRVHNESITGTGKLSEAHRLHSHKMFNKIMGRDFSKCDKYFQKLYKIRKYINNPKATIERVIKGPIFGSEK